MKQSTTLVLASINACVLLLVGWLWLSPGGQRATHWEVPAAIKPQLRGDAFSGAAGVAPAGQLAAQADRPIFSASRRPVSAALPQVPSRPDPLDAVHLYGVFSGSDGGGVIVSSEGKTRRLRVSDALGEWRLQTVREKDVVFARGTETRVIALVQAKQSQGARADALVPVARPQPLVFPQLAPQNPAAQPAVPLVPRTAASSSKPPPGFLIGGSR